MCQSLVSFKWQSVGLLWNITFGRSSCVLDINQNDTHHRLSSLVSARSKHYAKTSGLLANQSKPRRKADEKEKEVAASQTPISKNRKTSENPTDRHLCRTHSLKGATNQRSFVCLFVFVVVLVFGLFCCL